MTPLLEINNLTVEYLQGKHATPAVRNTNLLISSGETLALVGESGSGKSTLALSIMGLLPSGESRIPSGSIRFNNREVLAMTKEELRRVRGKSIAMIFQDPFSALNPVLTINYQIQEVIQLDEGKVNPERAEQLLSQVQLSDANRILRSYPHQLSGGQRQRVMIAMALARKPELLIADEPTTALDVTVQDEIIKLLVKLQHEMNMAMLFVTHNLGLVRSVAKNVAVMYDGEIVERGLTTQMLTAPKHSYTQNLLQSHVMLLSSLGAKS